MAIVKLDKVTRSFGAKQVLGGVSLQIEKGEIFGLLGPSGAGKTTLVNILTGQLSCGGTAEIFGMNCGRIGREVYRRTGAVLDNCGLYERLTCMDNMKLFARIHHISAARIAETLREVGLNGSERLRVKSLSKGMRQRLQLARAILHTPELLFLDEPTSGLDPATAEEIHALMRRLRENGTTLFLTTHNMDEAYRLCDRIALLHEGQIVEEGQPAAICRRHCSDSELHIVTSDGEELSLPNLPENAETVAALMRGKKLRAIHSAEPDLGTVFLRLTGKELTQ